MLDIMPKKLFTSALTLATVCHIPLQTQGDPSDIVPKTNLLYSVTSPTARVY